MPPSQHPTSAWLAALMQATQQTADVAGKAATGAGQPAAGGISGADFAPFFQHLGRQDQLAQGNQQLQRDVLLGQHLGTNGQPVSPTGMTPGSQWNEMFYGSHPGGGGVNFGEPQQDMTGVVANARANRQSAEAPFAGTPDVSRYTPSFSNQVPDPNYRQTADLRGDQILPSASPSPARFRPPQPKVARR